MSNLIEANIRVGVGSNIKQDDAAWSSIELAGIEFGLKPKASWLQALSKWDLALKAVDEAVTPGNMLSYQQMETKLICYHALSDYQSAYALAMDQFDLLTPSEKSETSYFAALGAWAMSDFQS